VTTDLEATGSTPEMTPESLARWEPAPFEPDPDREDVLPVLAAQDVPAALPRGEVSNLAHVRVQTSTRLQDFDAGGISLQRGDQVVVQGDRGQAIGTVVAPSRRVLVTEHSSRRILRRTTEHDLIQRERNEDKGRQAMPFARERILARKLPMKLTRVEYLHGGSKAVLYFSAEGRVDFRELVKDLAQRLRTRIEMRQIGVRDEAKMVGGIGVCGLRLCCHRYITKFEPVSIRMAKDQNLEHKGMPKLGKFVETPDGVGKVVELDILARRVRVALGQGKSEIYSADDVQPAPPPAPPPQRR
jgi:cell fate regulator YaaT (PSP1 superfamily)